MHLATGDLDNVSLHAEPPRDHPAHNTPLITTLITPSNKSTDEKIAKETDKNFARETGEDIVNGIDEDTARGNSKALYHVDLPTLLARLPALSRDNNNSSTPCGSTSKVSRSVLDSRAAASRPSARSGLLVAPSAGLTPAETTTEGSGHRSGSYRLDHRPNNNTNNTNTNTNSNNSSNTSCARTSASGSLSNTGGRGGRDTVSGGAVSLLDLTANYYLVARWRIEPTI